MPASAWYAFTLVEPIDVWYGPFWCPGCSRAHDVTLCTNKGEPCCPDCGFVLESQGEGDDDPEP